MPFKTTESITDPDFSTLGEEGSAWIAEADSGWVVDANGVKNTVPNPAGLLAFHSPSLYQRIADMADPLVAHVRCKIVVEVYTKSANMDIRVHLVEEENLTDHANEGAQILVLPAIVSSTVFVAMGQASHDWVGLTVDPKTGIMYASDTNGLSLGPIYNDSVTPGTLAEFGVEDRNWNGLAAHPTNGNIYACCGGSGNLDNDIFVRINGAGSFVPLGAGIKAWYGVAVAPNGDVYACAPAAAGGIWKQTGGSGAFVVVEAGSLNREWRDITVTPNGDVYACTYARPGYSGDIYYQKQGTVGFVSLSQTSRYWYGLASDSEGNVYAATGGLAWGGYIYRKQNGDGNNFVQHNSDARKWTGMAVDSDDNVYAAVFGGDVYKMNANPYIYEAYFTPPKTANWVVALTGANGSVGAESIIESIGIVQESDLIPVSITSGATDPTATTPIPCTVTFDEPVTGFTADDLVVTNGTVANFLGSGAVYTFNLVPSAGNPKVVKANIAAGVAANADGITNAAAPEFSRTYYTPGIGGAVTFVLEDISRIVDAES